MHNVRVFYKKVDRARYISHLDITRCMQRAIKRANLPVWYTEGFNPHIYMTFALPLSLGQQSLYESMDFRLETFVEFDELIKRLNEVLPPDIQMFKAGYQINKPDKITHAKYTINMTGDNIDELYKSTVEVCNTEEILVQKKTKKGYKEINIAPMFTVEKIVQNVNSVALEIKAVAGIEQNLNPSFLTDSIEKNYGGMISTDIIRCTVYMADEQVFE